jgi:hypothetical protein
MILHHRHPSIPKESLPDWFQTSLAAKNKKADVAEHPKVFDHVGLLFNEPLGKTGLLFVQSSDESEHDYTARIEKCNNLGPIRRHCV